MYSDEHRAELLERAYRRGRALRVRRRRWLAALAGVVVIVVAGGGAIAASGRNNNPSLTVGHIPPSKSTTSSSPNATTCAPSVSVVPGAEVPPDVAAWAQGAAVVGDGALWTTRANIDLPGSRQSNVWRVKFSWFTRPFGLPTITGHRLDGAGTFHADANPATDSRGTWVVSSLEFSGPGCWQVTGRYRNSTIRFRMRILANASPAPSTTSTTGSTTTTTTPPSAQALLSALRSAPFDGSVLPAHLHVVGVGPWQYADAGHVGNGYVGSAQVSLRSDDAGESIDGIYDVFTTSAAAAASFNTAYANFQRYSPAGSFQVLKLDPAVRAFCAPQAAPANTTTCWFVRGSTTATVTATTSSASSDGRTVLRAMLAHLVVLGG